MFFLILGIAIQIRDAVGFPSEACELDKYRVVNFLLTKNFECDYKVSAHDVMRVIDITNIFWNWETSNQNRYKLFSVKYKDELNKLYKIKSGNEYIMPDGEYERTWSGYMVEKIKITADTLIEVEVIINWQQEGYSGQKSYVFTFIKEKGAWMIVGIIS